MGLDITGLGSIFDLGGKIIDKLFPDKDAADKAKLELLKLQQAGEFKQLEMEQAERLQQVAVNLEEAKSPNVLVSGWRPGVGWVCVLGLCYSVFIQPILISCGVGRAPILDVSVIIELLFALLGIGGYRTMEKLKGVASK
jgi:hypothetical protein